MFESDTLTFNHGRDGNTCRLDSFVDVRGLQRLLKAQEATLQQEADERTTGPANCLAVDPDGSPILVDQDV